MLESAEIRLRAAYPSHEWVPVTHGMSGAATYRLDGRTSLFVKLARDSGLLAEARRIEWLAAAGFPSAKLVDCGAADGVEWLVMTAVPGRVASDPWPAEQRLRVIDAVAEMLGALHALPVSSCPFEWTLDGPAFEDVVVCHGDFCLPNVLVDPESLEPTGVIDVGRLARADRYVDLALMNRSIRGDLNPQYGGEHANRFLAAYGADPADSRLDSYARLF